jgi:multidrug efflux pump
MGGMLAATPLAVLFVPTFFVVVLRLFKTKPKLLGAHATEAHSPAHGATPPGGETPASDTPAAGDQP